MQHAHTDNHDHTHERKHTQQQNKQATQTDTRRSATRARSGLCVSSLLLLLLLSVCCPCLSPCGVVLFVFGDDCPKCSTESGALGPCGVSYAANPATVFLKIGDCDPSGSSATAQLQRIVSGASASKKATDAAGNGQDEPCVAFTQRIMCSYLYKATAGFSQQSCSLKPMCQSDCANVQRCQIVPGNMNCQDNSPLVEPDSHSPEEAGWSRCAWSGVAVIAESSTGLGGVVSSSTGGVGIAERWSVASLPFDQYQTDTQTTISKSVMVYGQNVTGVAVYKGIPYGQVGTVDANTGQFLLPEDWREPSAATYEQITTLVASSAASAANANALAALGVPSSQLSSGSFNFAATSYGSKCRQLVNGSFVGHRRDCLFFNVVTPYFKFNASDYNCTLADTACTPLSRNITITDSLGNSSSVFYDPPPLLPVIVFIHGGNHWTGSGEDVDPTALVLKSVASGAPVVVVTFNFRLGVWGFLAHADLSLERTEAKQTSGMYALEDQRLLLTVLKSRLLSFGGDATRITLLGDSSGATMACLHVMSSKSVGLFQKAILQGGACHTVYRTLPTAEAVGSQLAAALHQHNPSAYADCVSTQDLRPAACLRKSTTGSETDILSTLAIGLGCDRILDPFSPTLGPLIDGYIYDNYAANAIDSKTTFVPILMGTNTMEYASMIGAGLRNVTSIANLTEADLITQTVALLYDATIANQPLSNGGTTSSGVTVLEGEPAPVTSSVYSSAAPLEYLQDSTLVRVVTAMVQDWWTTPTFTQGTFGADTNLYHLRYDWAETWLRDFTADPVVLDKIVSLMTSYYSYCPQQRTAYNLWTEQKRADGVISATSTAVRDANRMYLYRFSYQSRNDTYAAFGAATQGSIMPYVFGVPSPVFNGGAFSELDVEMSEVLQFYWLHFVYTGRPYPDTPLFAPPAVSGSSLVEDWVDFNNLNQAQQSTEVIDGFVMKFGRVITSGQEELKFGALSATQRESPMLFECAIWSAMEKQVGSNWYYTPRDAEKVGVSYEKTYHYCQPLPPSSYCYNMLSYPLQSDGQMYVNVRGPFMCAADVEHFFLQVPPMIAALNTQSDYWAAGAKFDCGSTPNCHEEPDWGWPALSLEGAAKLPGTDYPQYIINPCAESFVFTLCRMFYRPCVPIATANQTVGGNATEPTTGFNSSSSSSSSTGGSSSSSSSTGGTGTPFNINTFANSVEGYTSDPCGSLCHNFRFQCPAALAQTLFQPVMDHYLPSPLTFDAMFTTCDNIEFWAPVLPDTGNNCTVVTSNSGLGSTITLPNDCQCHNASSPLTSSWWSKVEKLPGRLPTAPKCAVYNGTVCAGIINYPVYIAPGDDIVSMERRAEFLVPLQRLATVATGCRESFARHTCSSIFLACDNQAQKRASDAFGLTDPAPYDFLVPYPRFPCNLVCTTALSQCGGLFEAAPQSRALFNCTRIGLFNPLWEECADPKNPNTATETHSRYTDRVVPYAPPDYPNSTYVLREFAFIGTQEDDNDEPPAPRKNSHAGELNITCNDLERERWDQTRVAILCPYPMVTPENPAAATYAGGSCAMPCASILWTPEQWGYGENFFNGGVILGFLMILFLFLSYSIFPKNREKHYLAMFFTSVFLLSLMYFLQILYSGFKSSNFGCDSNSELNHQSNFGLCTLAGAFFMYFINASVQWWMALSWDFYNSLVRKKKYTKLQLHRQRIYMHIFAWGMPLIFVIVAFAEEAVGRTSTLPWCFMVDSVTTEVEWGIMWWPLLIRLLLGIYFMLRVFLQMYAKGSEIHRQGKGNKWEWFKNNVRVICLVLFFCFVFSWLIVYRAYMWYNASLYQSATKRYLECLIYGGGLSCGEKPDTYPNSYIWYGVICCVGAQGIACGLFYGWDKPNFRLWIGWCGGKGLDYFTKPDVDAPSRTDKEGGGYRDMFSATSGKALVSAPIASDSVRIHMSKKPKAAAKSPPPPPAGPKSPSGGSKASEATTAASSGGSSKASTAAPSSASSRLASPRPGPTRNQSVAASAVATPTASASAKPRPAAKGTQVAPGHFQYK